MSHFHRFIYRFLFSFLLSASLLHASWDNYYKITKQDETVRPLLIQALQLCEAEQ